ncbi:MAG: hypothetical protein NT062_07360 [Proteobacteria bacterium]|nr:hypothetical protein [Pseudomonadota bacterium]
MRAIVCLLFTACAVFEPIDDVPSSHAVYPDTAAAIAAILAEGTPRVFAVGEFHPSKSSGTITAPITRFTDTIIQQLQPYAQDLVVETWHDDCGAASLQPQLARALQRPVATGADIAHLARESTRLSIHTRGLAISCLEHQAMRDPTGSIDFFRLLQLVTTKLHEAALDALAGSGRPGVIIYGGALHNDLYPRWPLEDLSYAAPLARELGDGAVVELDLVVPEVVAPMLAVRLEPWFPLIGLASPSRVIVWRRGPHSFVVILPAQSEEIAKIARPAAS